MKFTHFYLFYIFVRCAYAWLPTPDPIKYFPYIKLDEQIEKFRGNASYTDFFNLLDSDVDSILIGSRDVVFNISLSNLTENLQRRIEWTSSPDDRQVCEAKGKSEKDCHNYIRVAVKVDDYVLVCGTNAFKPLCRRYGMNGSQWEVVNETSGIGSCPYDPRHDSTALSTDGQLYSATFADFVGLQPLIFRDPLRTELSDPKQLNSPKFVGSDSHGDYVYFFFREPAIEYANCGKIVYSRVARVCKGDRGGPYSYRDRWTSFTKARLNCSVPGDYPFYFNELQAISVVDSIPTKMIYGVFATPSNSIGGSAVCAFSMNSILNVFNGDFKGQQNQNSNWLKVPKNQVPTPRPGTCVYESTSLPDAVVSFINAHSLMDEAVPSHQPLLIKISPKTRFVSIIVDPQVKTVNGDRMDVLFIGTDDGLVLKGVNRVTNVSLFSEELEAIASRAPIRTLSIARTSPPKLVVVTNDDIFTLPLHRCSECKSCWECVGIQDPYCAWDPSSQVCLAHYEVRGKINLIQDVLNGVHRSCPPHAHGGSDPVIPHHPSVKYFSTLIFCSFHVIIGVLITNEIG